MIRRDEVIKIGQFNKPHGLKGELSFTFTDDIFDRSDCPFLVCEINGIFVPFYIEEYRFRTDETALMKLEDIDSDADARMFINRDVYFPKSYMDAGEEELSAPGDYFLGFKVTDETYGELGLIKEVDDSTENVLFIVDHNGEDLLIPANDDLVTGIDEEQKIIFMDIPEGLLQL